MYNDIAWLDYQHSKHIHVESSQMIYLILVKDYLVLFLNMHMYKSVVVFT